MGTHESFGSCLQRVLAQEGMSASEAARLVGFRSRNSIFRIISDDTSSDVDARFLSALEQAIGDRWQEKHWQELNNALRIKRVGLPQYLSDQAFQQAMCDPAQPEPLLVVTCRQGEREELPLQQLLRELVADSHLDIIISGCCERGLTGLLLHVLSSAGDEGRITVRHYIDLRPDEMVRNILGVLPLMGRVWYNARLVEEGACEPEMAAIYRLNMIIIIQTQPSGQILRHELIKYSGDHFVHRIYRDEPHPTGNLLDRCRFQLGLLKPLTSPNDGPAAFVDYTAQYAHLEKDGMILSIKPDVHFNCIPSHLLYAAILEGFEQADVATGPELVELMAQLQAIHEARLDNMHRKHRPTHLVYSLPAMERFMRTGVLTDQFFLQRAYTPQERCELLRSLHREALENPFFNIHFLRRELPEFHNEMTFYENKGVLMMDAYTGYDLHADHSEALITLPLFTEAFHKYFIEELLPHQTLSPTESLAELERLYTSLEE